MSLAVRDLRIGDQRLGPEAAAAFGLSPDDEAPTFVRTVLADGEPVAVMRDTVRPGVALPPEPSLRRALEAYAKQREADGMERLDYVFIDCPPSLGLLTLNAFVAATEVLIPIQCEYYALEGLSQLLKNIEMIQKHLNPELSVSTILLTMYDGRTNLASQVAEEVRNHFPAEVLETMIPRSVRISEAPSYQQSVISYDPSSTGALSYLEAAAEIAQRAQR